MKKLVYDTAVRKPTSNLRQINVDRKMKYLKEIRRENVEWIQMARVMFQQRILVNMNMNGLVSRKVTEFFE
jgi:hypothetical protein